ncbi:unnamed protein product [Rotaria sordida]|uniref:Uncharacterized protein n=2 Tax=Rotaria sordida TaxID=392033 RepID=A0A813TJA6_9BILA|nr:unnamed protein product [Rotaria sordida]CAF0812535.1 unnamed protein product [Rotaria sordida]CAF0837806.1 unnamed protein product [Rotaria sordida]
MILVQTIFSQATLTQSVLDNNNLKRMSSAWGKRMSSAWGKRMTSAWGKRGESDSDELYNHLLRELYHQARLSKYDYPRYPIDNEVYEQYLAQRTSSNNDDEAAPQNVS